MVRDRVPPEQVVRLLQGLHREMDVHSLIMIPIVNLVAYQLNPVHESSL